jgi:hypothetical protein
MELTGAASSAIMADIAAADRSCDVLGVADQALYLRTLDAVGVVVAVESADAVRLPCAVIIDAGRRDEFLTTLRPRGDDPPAIGSGRISWMSASGVVTLAVTSEWAPARPNDAPPRPDRIAFLRARARRFGHGLNESSLTALARAARFGHDAHAATDAVGALVGAGTGLTPSGDDALAGFVLGAEAFGLDVAALRSVLGEGAAQRTTALSAQLLRHALAGECIPELATLINSVAGDGEPRPALDALLRVGHTSGAALAAGVTVAAHAAHQLRTVG